jgi:hypothetical protein
MSLRKPQSDISGLTFTQLSGAASYVAASPDGNFWVLSTQGLPNGDKFIYHYVGNGNYVNIPGAASRIAVGPDGTPWVINAAGGIYRLVNNLFQGIAGGASDISLGGTAEAPLVDVISNQNPGPYGAGIYQYNVNTGTWSQLPGAGVTVAASIDNGTYPALNINPGGFYVTNQLGGIFYYNVGVGFEQLPGAAVRIAPTAIGGIFALGNPGSYPNGIYYNNLGTGHWTQMPGAAVSISANSEDVYAIGAAGGIYVSPITPVSGAPGGTGTPLTGPNLGYAATGYLGGWGPTAVANELQFPVQSGYNGSGYTVAIVVDGTVSTSDLSTYESWFETPQTGRTVISEPIDGGPIAPSTSTQNEAALDVETVAGLAPGANILIVEPNSIDTLDEDDAYNYVVSNHAANIVSSSFGGCEGPIQIGEPDTVESNIFKAGVAAGIAFVAASGDQGSACYDGTSNGNNTYAAGVDYPASDPNVIGVGGNETYPPPEQNPPISTLATPLVWNDSHVGQPQASGGGASTEFALPSYQLAVSGKASSQYRNVPDVAMPAVYAAIVEGGQWHEQEGTSWSTPVFAALLAEVYQYCGTTFTNSAALPYAVFSKSGYGAFINITSGNNGYAVTGVTTPTYYASSGYNNATGIGIPLGMPFAESLCTNGIASNARSSPIITPLTSSRATQAYTVNVAPAIRGLVDEGRKAANDLVRIQLGIEPGDDIVANESAIIQVLEANGFTVVQTFSNHLLVDATGPSGSVEQLFSTQMHNALQAGKAVYLPETRITVPSSIAPHASGVILDDVQRHSYPLELGSAPVSAGVRTP